MRLRNSKKSLKGRKLSVEEGVRASNPLDHLNLENSVVDSRMRFLMSSVEKEVDRVLTLLRNKIREQGYTQLEVQEKLQWGRSYISQLLTKQKSLRVEQVLLILETIQVEPREFYAELYPHGRSEDRFRVFDGYAEPRMSDPAVGQALRGGESAEILADSEDFLRNYRQVRAMMKGLIQALIDKDVVTLDEIVESAKALDPDLGPFG